MIKCNENVQQKKSDEDEFVVAAKLNDDSF